MKENQPPLEWNELDPETLNADAADAYRRYQISAAKAKTDRERFEKRVLEAIKLPTSQRLIFSYKFGRLSVAIGPAKRKNVGANAIDFNSLKALERSANTKRRKDVNAAPSLTKEAIGNVK